MEEQNRTSMIIQTSVIGIIANVFLAAFKAGVGIFSHSVSVVMDAVNNLSDALSSIITIVGTRLAGKEPDKNHPLGYGRMEYLTAVVIAVIVLYAGITALIESVKKILHPEIPNYTATSLVIIAAAVLVKIFLGRFVQGRGKKVNSDSLLASGQDAVNDAVLSAATLCTAVIYLLFHVSFEAYVGAFISLVIVKAGMEMLRDTINKILGERVDSSFTRQIRERIEAFPEVYGAYDLILNNYGPDANIASVHIEVADTMKAAEIADLLRRIEREIYREFHVFITGLSIYARNLNDEKLEAERRKIDAVLLSQEHVLQTHGFYLEKEKKVVHLDVVLDFDCEDRSAEIERLQKLLKVLYPEMSFVLQADFDVTD